MTLYLDARALVPLFSMDDHSDHATALIRRNRTPLAISDFARAEVASVVGRLVRMRDMTVANGALLFSRFDEWVADYATAVELRPVDLVVAEGWLRRLDLNLRAPDALHIAITRRLDATLVTFDRRMEQTARSLGVATEGIGP